MAVTGQATLIDQDGTGWPVWVQSGEIHVEQNADFMVLPMPTPGHVWALVPIGADADSAETSE